MGETAESFSAPRDDISLRIFGCFQGTDLMGSVHWWIKQANGQGDTRGVIFLWRRGARTIRLIFGHPHIWSVTKVLGSCQKKYYYQAISSKWIFQITLSQPPLLWKMTSKADTKIHSTDEIYELQQGIDESQNHSIILICIKYVCSVSYAVTINNQLIIINMYT